MRIQYAVVCHDFEDGEWYGVTNLRGVRHKLYASVDPGYFEDGGTHYGLPVKLVVSLIEGTPGNHTIHVSVRRPTGEAHRKIMPLPIAWDEASPTFFAIFDINLEVAGNGTYEFAILADGEPLGTVPLPVELSPLPR